MKIKIRLQNLIEASEVNEAIRILKFLVVNPEFSTNIILQSARFNDLYKEKTKGLVEDQIYRTQLNLINLSLIHLISELPQELELLIERLTYLIKHQKIFSSAIEILEIVCRDDYYNQAKDFNIKFIASQDFENKSNSDSAESVEIDKWYISNEVLGEEILEFINKIDENCLLNNWEDKLWNYIKVEKNEYSTQLKIWV